MVEQILKELDENLCSELNEHDPSVGIYKVQHLDNEVLEDLEGVTVLSVTKDNAILLVEGHKIELYAEEDPDLFYWKVREYKEEEVTANESN